MSRNKVYNNVYQNQCHQKLLYNNPSTLQPFARFPPVGGQANRCEGYGIIHITYIPSKNETKLQLKDMISARVNLILKI